MAISSSLPHLFFISILVTITTMKNITPVHAQCLEDQKTLLLELKSELIFDSSFSEKLVHWNQTDDCCRWDGVECDAAGHVISLQLDGEAISGGIDESSSLFRVRYLKKLNLANNGLSGIQIPRGIQHLTYLEHLNLSFASFGGQIPVEISLLRRLVVLDIASDWNPRFHFNYLKLEHPNLKMLVQNLTRLTELHLEGVDVSAGGSEWCQAVSSSLPDLKILSLQGCELPGPFHPSLLQLHSLSVLRLDWNNLSTTVPDFLANFTSLTALTLRGCSLRGSFPKMVLQVPTLQELDLSYNELLGGTIPQFSLNRSALRSIHLSSCSIVGSIPSTLGNLTELIDVDLSNNFLTGLIPSFYMSKKIATIDLSSNSLMGTLSDSHFEGLSNLAHLNLQYNSFSGSIPHSLFGLPSLQTLTLSQNQFSGQIKEIPIVNISNIEAVDLWYNSFSGSIPVFLFGLSSLLSLTLSNNQFSEFPPFVNFSNIQYLDSSYNSFNGSVPLFLFTLPSLQTLVLSNNQFSGQINEFSIVNISNMDSLYLSNNRFEGPIPDSLFHLQSLKYLLLSDNLFNGLSFNLSVDVPLPMLNALDLSNNRIAGVIPNWIWKIGNGTLSKLNVSCNMFVGVQKPYHFSTSLWILDLHSNQLGGELPPVPEGATHVDYSNNNFDKPISPTFFANITSTLSFLSLANNSLIGAIPTSLCNVISLEVLDLSSNKLSNNIPSCLFENVENLQVLNLKGNKINGVIPDQFSATCGLITMDLSDNNLHGKIPRSLENCQNLDVMNVAYNNFDDSFPCLLSPSLHVLVLRSNKFHGELRCDKSWPNLQIVDISSNNFNGSLHLLNLTSWRGMMLQSDAHLRPNRSSSNFLGEGYNYRVEVTLTVKGLELNLVKIWPDFTSIDFSCNNFQGGIPDVVGNLTSLYLLNLSHNALTATIPKSLGALTELGSLDLSVNQLRGRIPEELARLTFLSVLNVSYNELVGPIPTGPQFQTFSADCFEGNIGLCGFPLNRSCSSTDGIGSTPPEVKDDEIEWEYVCGAVGYVVGLGSIVWVLLFCRRFREKYFDKIEEVVERIYVRKDERRRLARRRVIRRQ